MFWIWTGSLPGCTWNVQYPGVTCHMKKMFVFILNFDKIKSRCFLQGHFSAFHNNCFPNMNSLPRNLGLKHKFYPCHQVYEQQKYFFNFSMWFDFSSVLLQLPGVENLQCFDKHDETLPSRQEQFVAYFFINIVFNNATKSHTSRNELYNGVGAMRIT